MKIFIVGSGKLANAIVGSGLSFQACEIIRWETRFRSSHEKAIVVHAGSGRQVKECFEFCGRTKSPFIELATGLDTGEMQTDFPLILCPNTSILVLKTLHMLKTCGRNFENDHVSITESHQASKKTEPGTAYAFGKALHVPSEKIVSIRDPEIQRETIGIAEEYLDKHAYHKIVIRDGLDEVTIETKVLGHDSYASGLKAIIETVLQYDLDHNTYTVLDFIEKNML